jgi:hypothetical protein
MEKIIISKEEKFALLKKCIPISKKYLDDCNKKFNGSSSHIKDALDGLEFIEKSNAIRYRDAFFYLVALSQHFLKIKNEVEAGVLDFSFIKNPNYWDNGKIDLDVSVFFACTFFNELFKEEIKEDFEKLNKMETVDEYYAFRKEILNKT